MTHVPTILIGLGGLGSYIVDTVYGWIPEERRKHVAIHAFDTNVNDIAKLKHLTKEHVTQTSTNWTVGEYIRMADESVKDWFPHEHSELLRKSLTDGAGQIRSVSRLAYRAAIEGGKLNKLHSSINHIFRETGAGTTSSARVMIVSSLVGGTGAGIFLQTAMYMRDVLELDFHRKNVLVRGAFLLPDTLVLTNVIQGDEVENIRANAYASIKELNAITNNASNSDNGTSTTIELEYKPNQVDSAGRLAHEIAGRNLPYDFCFLFDFENTEKNNLKYFGNYIQQVARTTYLDLFSPISNDRFSQQDNRILSMIENNGMNRYCGSGVATIEYPYEDMVYYCALKWSTDSLSQDWLKIDEQFDSDYRQYERDLKNGIPREKPEIGERYMAILQRFATQQNPRPFFKLAYRSVHTLDKRGEINRPKAEIFIENIEKRIAKVIAEDEKLQAFQAECGLDENRLQQEKTARDEVSNREDSLYYYEQEIRKFIDNTKNYLVNEIILQDGDHPRLLSGDDYKLNTWLLKQPEPLHPVAVRYTLYQIYSLLEEYVGELAPKNEILDKGIQRYKKAYDLDDSEEVESAEDRLRKAGRQSFFGKIINNQFKDFVNEYIDKSSKHLNNLNRFRTNRLTELVFRELMKAMKEMADDWEKYFKNLRDTRNSLNNELNILAQKHEKGSDPTVKYILAKQEMKEQIWERIRTSVSSDELPIEISEQIYKGQYQRFCKKRKGNYITEQRPEKIEEMFRKDVVGWCRKELYGQDALNLNCIRALRREAELEGKSEQEVEQFIKDQITLLNNLARPFVPSSNTSVELNAWGAHPDSIKELTGEMQKSLFEGTDLVEDDAFSPYSIIRNRTLYGLTINQLSKFSHGDDRGTQPPGEYYKAYYSRVNKLTRGKSVTPHLDKRWHLPAYLPELSSKRVTEDKAKIDRALIWGVILEYLIDVDQYGQKTWQFDDDAGSRLIHEGSKPADHYIHSLHAALLHNPIIVDKVLLRTNEQFERDRKEKRDKIEEHNFYSKAQNVHYYASESGSETINIVDLILQYSLGDPGDASLMEKGNELLKVLLNELVAYFQKVYGQHRAFLAKKDAIAYINDMFEKSVIYQQADKRSVQRRSWDSIWKKVVDDAAVNV